MSWGTDEEYLLAMAEEKGMREAQRWREKQREARKERERIRREQLKREIAAMSWRSATDGASYES